ncbi:MAG TPA: hypothetical protein ENK85_01125 [Saprospiraceae bacterium]|nr:hypothetical protein [Saprospiraceae bacterium]
MKNLLFLAGLLSSILLHAQPQVSLELVASGFDSPLEIVHAKDDRLFVCERAGLIKIITSDDNVLPTPFLDLTDSVKSCGGNCEVGLMGLAFDPDYANNGYFYVTYTSRLDWGASPWNATMRVSRFKVDAQNPNLADKASETIVMEVYEPFINHNGGSIRFGPDGYLYLGWGDGGFEDITNPDPYHNAQNPKKLLGKILRIDVSQLPYSIPADNPFVGDTTVLDEIWALGIRNPWKFNFDSQTGDFWLADVQHASQEEIDFHKFGTPAGQNYGWKCYEGDNIFDTTGCTLPIEDFTFPVHTYDHLSDSCFSVSGGVVYRGNASDLAGYYVYGDFCREFIGGIKPDGQGGWISDTLAYTPNVYISAIGEGFDQNLYVVDFGYGNPGTGKIHRIKTKCMDFSVQTFISNPIQCDSTCNGIVQFTPTSPNGSTFDFSWHGTQSTNLIDLTLTGVCSGMDSLQITDNAGCQLIYYFELTPEHPTPVPVIQVNDNELSLSGTFSSYQWYLDTAAIPDATNNTYTPTESGFYSVAVTNEFGCTGYSDTLFVEVVGTENITLNDASIVLGPNPTDGTLNIEISHTNNEPIVLSVIDALGHVLEAYTTHQPIWKKVLDLSPLSGKTVWIRIQRGEEQVLRPVIVK